MMGRQEFFVPLLQFFSKDEIIAKLQKNIKEYLFPSGEVPTGRDIRKPGVLDNLYLDPGWEYRGAYLFKFP